MFNRTGFSVPLFRSVPTMSLALRFFVLLLALSLTPALAQSPDDVTPPAVEQSSGVPMPNADAQSGMSGSRMEGMDGMESKDSMNSIAASMKAMADMCREMMEREMAAMPYKMAAYIFFGLLLTTVLILLVALQVQWIIYWKRLLKDSAQP